jgi:hypothetical protein
LVRLDDQGAVIEAIEVELTTKGAARLDQLLRAWRHAVLGRRIERVVYRCAPRTLPYVRRAVERTKTESVILVEELQGETAAMAGRASDVFGLREGH